MPSISEAVQKEVARLRIQVDKANAKVIKSLDLIQKYGDCGGVHHKDWIIDQLARILADDKYEQFVKDCKAGVDGAKTHEYSVGIAP